MNMPSSVAFPTNNLEQLLVAGRVIQPWEEDRVFSAESPFCFAGLRAAWIDEFMGGNFSVCRATALALGGFDENFVCVDYRFEAEFAHRLLASGRLHRAGRRLVPQLAQPEAGA